MVLPEMGNNLGITLRLEAVALRFEGLTLLDVIEQLAIENDKGALILIRDRLLTILEPNDAQASPVPPLLTLARPESMQPVFICRTGS